MIRDLIPELTKLLQEVHYTEATLDEAMAHGRIFSCTYYVMKIVLFGNTSWAVTTQDYVDAAMQCLGDMHPVFVKFEKEIALSNLYSGIFWREHHTFSWEKPFRWTVYCLDGNTYTGVDFHNVDLETDRLVGHLPDDRLIFVEIEKSLVSIVKGEMIPLSYEIR